MASESVLEQDIKRFNSFNLQKYKMLRNLKSKYKEKKKFFDEFFFKNSKFLFFRAYECFIFLQVFFIVYVDLVSHLVTSRRYYFFFFILSHLVFSLLHSIKFPLAFDKKKSLVTPAQQLKKDLLIFFNVFAKVLPRLGLFYGSTFFLGYVFTVVCENLNSVEAVLVFLFSCLYSYFVSIFVFFLLEEKKQRSSPSFKISALKNKIYRKNSLKKLCLFEKKTKGKKKNFLISILRILSYLNTLTFLRFFFILSSFYLDYGRSYAMVYLLHAILTYVLFSPFVRDRLFSLYDKDCLRLLGWNMVYTTISNYGKGGLFVGIAGSLAVGFDRVTGYVLDNVEESNLKRENNDRIKHINDIRLADPEGAIVGRYQHVDLLEDYRRKNSGLKHLAKTLGNAGEVVVEGSKLRPKSRAEIIYELLQSSKKKEE